MTCAQRRFDRLVQFLKRLTERPKVMASCVRALLSLVGIRCLAQGHFGRHGAVDGSKQRAVFWCHPGCGLSHALITSEHIWLCSCASAFLLLYLRLHSLYCMCCLGLELPAPSFCLLSLLLYIRLSYEHLVITC